METTKFVPMTDEDFNKALNYVSNYRDHLESLKHLLNKKKNKDIIKKLDDKLEELNKFLDEYLIFGQDDYENV